MQLVYGQSYIEMILLISNEIEGLIIKYFNLCNFFYCSCITKLWSKLNYNDSFISGGMTFVFDCKWYTWFMIFKIEICYNFSTGGNWNGFSSMWLLFLRWILKMVPQFRYSYILKCILNGFLRGREREQARCIGDGGEKL